MAKLFQTLQLQQQLHVGDKIIAVDGKETTTWEKLNFALIDRVGETGTVNIDVDRAGSKKFCITN